MSDDEAARALGASTGAVVTTASVSMTSAGAYHSQPASSQLTTSVSPTVVVSSVSVADDEAQLKRQYDELQELFIETQQDRQELTARYGQVQKQLERIHMENEYLMGELSQYTASDLESDQSDIELHYSSHTRKALLSPTEASESDPIASKPKPKSGSKTSESAQPKDTAAAVSKPKRKRISSISTTTTPSLPTASKKVSPNAKKAKNTAD